MSPPSSLTRSPCRLRSIRYACTKKRPSGSRPIRWKDPSKLLADADRGAALAGVLLRGVFGSPDPRDVEAKLADHVAEISEARKKAARDAPFLVITVELDVQSDFGGTHNDRPSYSIYFDAVGKDDIRASARPKADRVLAAAIVASDGRVTAVVAAETFSDLRTVATERAPFFFTSGVIARAFLLAEQEGGFRIDAVSPVMAAAEITRPVLLIHGAAGNTWTYSIRIR